MSKGINLFEQQIETVDETDIRDEGLSTMLEKIQNRADYEEREKTAHRQVKGVIEAVLFSSSDPVSFNKIREVTDALHPFKPKVLESMLEELKQDYQTQGRAYVLEQIDNGYILRTREEYGKYVDLLYTNKRMDRLSHAATEVLAIIAHKQPVTRPQIEEIRGVDSSGTVYSLVERGLIEVTGRAEGPGRPSLYSVTTEFMKYFGISDLDALTRRRPDKAS